MGNNQMFWIGSVCLALISGMLLLYLVGVDVPTAGQAVYALETGDPLCVVKNFEGEFVVWHDVERCCYMIRTQASCSAASQQVDGMSVDYMCTTSSPITYYLNSKAHKFCRIQPVGI